jgi:hypothetical protein
LRLQTCRGPRAAPVVLACSVRRALQSAVATVVQKWSMHFQHPDESESSCCPQLTDTKSDVNVPKRGLRYRGMTSILSMNAIKTTSERLRMRHVTKRSYQSVALIGHAVTRSLLEFARCFPDAKAYLSTPVGRYPFCILVYVYSVSGA